MDFLQITDYNPSKIPTSFFPITFKVLVYSVSSRQSLEELGQIVRTLREVKGDAQMGDVPVMLVGNKADDAHVSGDTIPH